MHGMLKRWVLSPKTFQYVESSVARLKCEAVLIILVKSQVENLHFTLYHQ